MQNRTHTLVAVLGAFVGLIGVEHGIGEILQGSTVPEGRFILSWPNAPFFAVLNGEPAFTIVPDLRLTGILAVGISLLFAGWVVFFVPRKYGALGLAGLSALMFLFGGGIFPPVLGLILSGLAAMIRIERAPAGVTRRGVPLLGRLWGWFFGLTIAAWLAMFPGVPLLRFLAGVENDAVILTVLAAMFGGLLLTGAAGVFGTSAK